VPLLDARLASPANGALENKKARRWKITPGLDRLVGTGSHGRVSGRRRRCLGPDRARERVFVHVVMGMGMPIRFTESTLAPPAAHVNARRHFVNG
jgi:hypothetical protein